jgi:hypothetical protein
MPLLLIPLGLILLVGLFAISLPFSIRQRYKMGTARRLARPWLAAVNAIGMAISALMLLVTVGISAAWIPQAFTYSAAGLAGGVALGCLGIAITRWEAGPRSLHYTPNRWLILALTVGVALRICFGFWRAWHVWHTTPGVHSWLAEAGVAGSMAAGAVVLGYYLAYWFGIWARVASHRRRGAYPHRM